MNVTLFGGDGGRFGPVAFVCAGSVAVGGRDAAVVDGAESRADGWSVAVDDRAGSVEDDGPAESPA